MGQHQQIDPLRVLARHAQQIAAARGLVMRDFLIRPCWEPDGADRAIVAMEHDPDAKKRDEVVVERADQALTEQLLEAQREALEQRAAEARTEIQDMLSKRLRGDGGFLEP